MPEAGLKVVIAGGESVGKTVLKERMTGAGPGVAEDVRPTVGFEFSATSVELEGRGERKVMIFDCGGNPVYKPVMKTVLRKVDVLMLVYDATRPETLTNLDIYLPDSDSHCSSSSSSSGSESAEDSVTTTFFSRLKKSCCCLWWTPTPALPPPPPPPLPTAGTKTIILASKTDLPHPEIPLFYRGIPVEPVSKNSDAVELLRRHANSVEVLEAVEIEERPALCY